MKQGLGLGGLALVLMLSLVGCGSSAPGLTAAELAQKYPQEKYIQIDGVALRYKQEGLGRPSFSCTGYPRIRICGAISPQASPMAILFTVWT